MNNNLKPFHPLGLPDSRGGVSTLAGQVVLYDPLTGLALARTPLPPGVTRRGLYLEGRLFELFPGQAWYTALPWSGSVELCLTRLERDRVVQGVISFPQSPSFPIRLRSGRDYARAGQAMGGSAAGPYPWLAAVYYDRPQPSWEIEVPLPPDHPFYSDVALRLALAGAVYQALGAQFPAVGQPGETLTVDVSNIFAGPELFGEQPFLIYRLHNPRRFLEQVYGWAFEEEARGQG